MHDTDGLGHFLHRKEGVTQGDTLEIITYGIGILPITREIRAAHHIVMQTWYDDVTGAGGNFADIWAHLEDLMVHGTLLGYLPSTTKSILVVSPNKFPQEYTYF